MIAFRVILLFALQFFYSSSHSQVDPHKLDSLSKVIDSSANSDRRWQDSFNKIQDSLYQASVTDKDSNQRNDDKNTEEKSRQESFVRIIIGVLICIGLITGLSIRKKPKS